jgi:hypothetical protein
MLTDPGEQASWGGRVHLLHGKPADPTAVGVAIGSLGDPWVRQRIDPPAEEIMDTKHYPTAEEIIAANIDQQAVERDKADKRACIFIFISLTIVILGLLWMF